MRPETKAALRDAAAVMKRKAEAGKLQLRGEELAARVPQLTMLKRANVMLEMLEKNTLTYADIGESRIALARTRQELEQLMDSDEKIEVAVQPSSKHAARLLTLGCDSVVVGGLAFGFRKLPDAMANAATIIIAASVACSAIYLNIQTALREKGALKKLEGGLEEGVEAIKDLAKINGDHKALNRLLVMAALANVPVLVLGNISAKIADVGIKALIVGGAAAVIGVTAQAVAWGLREVEALHKTEVFLDDVESFITKTFGEISRN